LTQANLYLQTKDYETYKTDKWSFKGNQRRWLNLGA
jgi:hypothetical protein